MNDHASIEAEAATPVKMADILAAIVAAMGEIKKVGKGGENKHDKYMFAGIDDFLSMVNPICAKHGLVFFVDEAVTEDFIRKGKYGDSSWMRQTFAITTYHISGQTLPPVTRSVEVLRNGGTAYGSAQSYVLKQFLRSLFLIPTGDKDDIENDAAADGAIEKPRLISADQFLTLSTKAEQAGVADDKIASAYGAAILQELHAADYDSAIRKLDVTIAAKATADQGIPDNIEY